MIYSRMIYKCESKDNIFKIFGEKFINNNREKYIIKYKNKILDFLFQINKIFYNFK